MKESSETVIRKLLHMDEPEFEKKLEAHQDGDIAKALIKTGAIGVWKPNI